MAKKRHRLGEHPAGAAKPQQSKKTDLWNAPPEIDAAFRKLFEPQAQPAERNAEFVATYLQAFISWCKENRAPKTTARYFDFLDAFERRYHGLTVSRLTTAHVTERSPRSARGVCETRRDASPPWHYFHFITQAAFGERQQTAPR